jgi:NADH:ubiquinone oxidoreductase subunit E
MSAVGQERMIEVVDRIPEEELVKLDPIIAKYAHRPGYLIPALKEAQEIFGYLPQEVQTRIAHGLNVSPSYVYGVVSFYAFFTMVPRGRHTIRICLGTACYVKGAPEILAKVEQELGIGVGGTTPDRRFTLVEVRCLGACGLAPVMMVGEDTHGNLQPGTVMDILDQYK